MKLCFIFLSYCKMAGETINGDKSSIDNVNEIDLVQQDVKKSLNFLAKEIKNSTWNIGDDFYKSHFYEKNADGTVSYNMKLVEQYLNEFEKWSHEQWHDIYGDPACVMAVQIALEGEWYEVGKIDGVFWDGTKNAIKKFQLDNGLKVDGLIWHKVVSRILEQLRNH